MPAGGVSLVECWRCGTIEEDVYPWTCPRCLLVIERGVLFASFSPEVVIPGECFVVRGWVQSKGLSTGQLEQAVRDQVGAQGGWQRYQGRWPSKRWSARFGTPGTTSTLGGKPQRVQELSPGSPVDDLRLLVSETLGTHLNLVYMNLYTEGSAGFRRHYDGGFEELQLWTTIASVSLGAARDFCLWDNGRQRTRLPKADVGPMVRVRLRDGDLCVMHGPCQLNQLHSVPPDRTVEGSRLSMTFRRHHRING